MEHERAEYQKKYTTERDGAAAQLAALKLRARVIGGEAKVELDKAFDLATAKIEHAGKSIVHAEEQRAEKWDVIKEEAEIAFRDVKAALSHLVERVMHHETAVANHVIPPPAPPPR
jgi:hypothetical protein